LHVLDAIPRATDYARAATVGGCPLHTRGKETIVMGQLGRGGLTVATVLFLSACAGDAEEQPLPADDVDTGAPAAPAPQPGQTTPPGAGGELPAGVTQEMVAQGEQIFNQQICFSCHGANGVGSVLGPALTDQEWLNTDGSYEGIMDVVRTGVAEPVQFQAPMPPMGGIQLSDEQIRQVAAYVYSLSHGG
jgi:mono/diheme cytochrome c family protein